MKWFRTYPLFFNSVWSGVFIWFLFFVFTPITPLEVLKSKTIVFIACCYIALIVGFLVVKRKKQEHPLIVKKLQVKWFYIIATIILISYTIRWIDLFYYRNLSLENDYLLNRDINSSKHTLNIIFSLAAVFKSIYFFPFVYCMFKSLKNTKTLTLVIAITCLLFPIVEALVFGTRKPFFELFLIIIVISIIINKQRLNFKFFAYILVGLIVILSISAGILFKRHSPQFLNREVFLNQMLTARYNDLVVPKKNIIFFINNQNRPFFLRMGGLILLQTGQYITHGVFEFNHIIDDELPATKGEYTFYPFVKFINQITHKNDFQIINPSPRKYVYITAFGGLFIDFKWVSLIFFFLFGAFQKVIYVKSQTNVFYKPILIYFLVINVSLIFVNYFRGAGIYPLVAFASLLIILHMSEKPVNEKSVST